MAQRRPPHTPVCSHRGSAGDRPGADLVGAVKTLHLFAGAGGGLLADLILGHTPVAAVEWDHYCCDVLRERFPDITVHEGDVRDFDPTDYAGRVDAIHAGFPCQDVSVAGKGAGIKEGTRSGLWSEVIRCARVLRPQYLFLENVAAITGNGLHRVLADLAALGFDARWDCVRASDVGANHKRDRWWCVAYANSAQREGGRVSIGVHAQHPKPCGGSSDEKVADAECFGLPGSRKPVDAVNSAAAGNWEATEPRDGGWWGVEPDLGRVAHGVAHRVDRLKAIGNGQVPLQAAYAFQGLMP